MTLVFLSLLAIAPAANDAVAAETRAFAAIDDNRWCDAAAHFEQAHQAAPSSTLLKNAGEAAVKAGDIRWAKSLLRKAKQIAPRKDRRALSRRIRVVTRQQQTTTCSKVAPSVQSPEVAPDETPGPNLVPEETPTAVSPTPAPESGAPATSTPDADPVVPVRPQTSDSDLPLLSIAGLSVAGGGAIIVVSGLVLGAIGAVPWLAYADAQTRLLDAEQQRADGTSAFADQVAAESQWSSYGQPLAVAAPLVAGLGATLVIAGVATWLVAPSSSSEGTTE